MADATEEEVIEIQRRVEPYIISQPGVQGIGMGLVEGQPGLRIFVLRGVIADSKRREIEARIHAESGSRKVHVDWDEGDEVVPYSTGWD